MVQYIPVHLKEKLIDCSACIAQQVHVRSACIQQNDGALLVSMYILPMNHFAFGCNADENSARLCETVCMVQYFPMHLKENLTDCPACIAQQAEVGYEQYDHLHAMLEVSINSSSLLPEVMRLRWFPTSDDPVFSESGIQVQ